MSRMPVHTPTPRPTIYDMPARGDVPSPIATTPIGIAVQLLGGAMAPTAVALRAAGAPGVSHSAIWARRRAGTLPVREILIGGHYYVTAAELARAFLGAAAPEPPRRRPGRPRTTDAARVVGGAS